MGRLLQLEDEEKPVPPAPPFALWALGFRPLYLCAGLFAALSIGAWATSFSGGGIAGVAMLSDPLWHAHEMIFGFAFAVIVGFLFTAVRNWTGQPTPTGGALAATVALWLAARVPLALPWPFAAAEADTAERRLVTGAWESILSRRSLAGK